MRLNSFPIQSHDEGVKLEMIDDWYWLYYVIIDGYDMLETWQIRDWCFNNHFFMQLIAIALALRTQFNDQFRKIGITNMKNWKELPMNLLNSAINVQRRNDDGKANSQLNFTTTLFENGFLAQIYR